MDMKTIIKNNVGNVVANKLSGDMGRISGVEDGENFMIFVKSYDELLTLTFMEFVTTWNIEFTF